MLFCRFVCWPWGFTEQWVICSLFSVLNIMILSILIKRIRNLSPKQHFSTFLQNGTANTNKWTSTTMIILQLNYLWPLGTSGDPETSEGPWIFCSFIHTLYSWAPRKNSYILLECRRQMLRRTGAVIAEWIPGTEGRNMQEDFKGKGTL